MGVPNYWFRAKRYGWGWPSARQGWLAMAVYLALFGAGFVVFPPGAALLGYAAVITALLIAVCWLKGEPPRWR